MCKGPQLWKNLMGFGQYSQSHSDGAGVTEDEVQEDKARPY